MLISEGTKQVTFGTQRFKASVYNEFASLQELVFSAMERIEALAIEGLNIYKHQQASVKSFTSMQNIRWLENHCEVKDHFYGFVFLLLKTQPNSLQ